METNQAHGKTERNDPMYNATSDAMRICDDYRFWTRENRDRIRDLNNRVEEVSTEEYRDWVLQWRKEYKWLSAVIRAMKGARKEFRYAYREKGETKAKARTKIGPNPNYHPKATWHLDDLSMVAHSMMLARTRSKERYKEMRETEDA